MFSIETTRLLVGVLLLTLGRRLFWLFVGAVGFVLGTQFAERFMQGQPDATTVLFALVCGVVFAVLAMFLKKAALGIAGFFAGGYLLWRLSMFNGWDGALSLSPWIFFFIGGVIGSALINTFFTWALVALSAAGGAALVCETLDRSLHPGPQTAAILFTALTVAGALFQLGVLRRLR